MFIALPTNDIVSDGNYKAVYTGVDDFSIINKVSLPFSFNLAGKTLTVTALNRMPSQQELDVLFTVSSSGNGVNQTSIISAIGNISGLGLLGFHLDHIEKDVDPFTSSIYGVPVIGAVAVIVLVILYFTLWRKK